MKDLFGRVGHMSSSGQPKWDAFELERLKRLIDARKKFLDWKDTDGGLVACPEDATTLKAKNNWVAGNQGHAKDR